MAGKIIVAGHICLDITPVFSSEKTRPLKDVLVPGKMLHMKDVNISTGGAVANTGLALKILGADVKLMGKIGDDEFGSIVKKKLREYEADKGLIVSEESSTSYSVVIAPPGTDRIFLHNPGANDTFAYEDLDFERIREAQFFHFGYPPVMKRMYKNEGEELVRIFKEVKKAGVITSLDMSAIDPETDAGRTDWEKILKRIMPFVDYFVPSIEELGYMLDKEKYYQWIEKADGGDVTSVITIEQDVKPLARRLLLMGAKNVLIKCGAPGMYFKNKDIEVFEKSYKPEKVLSGTGAGDTSIAAFLKALMDGCEIQECLKLAAATGAECVGAYDALGGLKPFEELRRKIEAGWEKQELITII